jgi:hypothetical protein
MDIIKMLIGLNFNIGVVLQKEFFDVFAELFKLYQKAIMAIE